MKTLHRTHCKKYNMCILSTYSKHFLLDEHFWSSIQKIYFGPITVHDFYQLLLI